MTDCDKHLSTLAPKEIGNKKRFKIWQPPLRGGLRYCEVDLRECSVERFDLRSRCFVFGM